MTFWMNLNDPMCFLSRASIDGEDHAVRLYNALKESGIQAWEQTNDSYPSYGYAYAEEALENCDMLFLVLTNAVSYPRGTGVCAAEWDKIHSDYGKLRVVLRFEETEKRLFIGNWQEIDFSVSFDAGFKDLIRFLVYLKTDEGQLTTLKIHRRGIGRFRKKHPAKIKQLDEEIERLEKVVNQSTRAAWQAQEKLIPDQSWLKNKCLPALRKFREECVSRDAAQQTVDEFDEELLRLQDVADAPVHSTLIGSGHPERWSVPAQWLKRQWKAVRDFLRRSIAERSSGPEVLGSEPAIPDSARDEMKDTSSTDDSIAASLYQGDYMRARTQAQRKLGNASGNKLAKAENIAGLAKSHVGTGESRRAARLIEKAIQTVHGNLRREAAFLLDLAAIYADDGKLEDAIKTCTDAEQKAQEAGGGAPLARALAVFGNFYRIRDNSQAARYYSEAIRVADKCGHLSVRKGARLELVFLDPSEAFLPHASLATTIDVPMLNADAWTALGAVLLNLARRQEASDAFEKGVSAATELTERCDANFRAWDSLGLARTGLLICHGSQDYQSVAESFSRWGAVRSKLKGYKAVRRHHLDAVTMTDRSVQQRVAKYLA